MKNPFLSMWLSQANAWSGAMRLACGRADDLAAPVRARWPLDPDAPPAIGAGVKA